MFSYDAIKNIIKFNENVKLLFNNINSDELKNIPLIILQKTILWVLCKNFEINKQQKPMDYSPEIFVQIPKEENSEFVKKYLI